MTLVFKTALLGCAAAAIAGPALADTVTIRDFIGRVEIVTGNTNRLDVEIVEGSAGETPRVDRRGDSIDVDGGWDFERSWRRGWNWGWDSRGWGEGMGSCRGDGDDREVRTEPDGDFHRFSELPLIRVTAPRDVHVEIERSLVDGQADVIGSAEIGVIGCANLEIASVTNDMQAAVAGSGTVTIGEIGGRLEANVAGSGAVIAGNVRSVDGNVAGSGDLRLGAVSDDAKLNIAGSGDVHVASVAGRLDGNIAGSGAITIAGGQSERVSFSVMGSGDVMYGGTARRADVNVFGSGDVDIANADDSDVHVAGSGDVRINGVRVR